MQDIDEKVKNLPAIPKETYEAIELYYNDYQEAPTIRELTTLIDRSMSNVHHRLKRLEKLGLLEKRTGGSRCWHLTGSLLLTPRKAQNYLDFLQDHEL